MNCARPDLRTRALPRAARPHKPPIPSPPISPRNAALPQIGNIAGDPGVVGALSGVLSPLLCGNPLLSGGGLLGSFAWTLGAIPPGATVTALFPGFLSTGLLGVPVNIWVVVNNLVRSTLWGQPPCWNVALSRLGSLRSALLAAFRSLTRA
jgi:hypothetical protein